MYHIPAIQKLSYKSSITVCQIVRCLQGAVIDWSIYGGLRLQDTSAHLERFIYSFIYSLVNISLELVGGCHDEDEENRVLRKLSVGHIKIPFR